MTRILFIESSATLRHALSKQLQYSDYDVSIEDSYEMAATYLAEHEKTPTYDSIVIGWPTIAQAATDELLAALSESPFDQIPVIVLSHETDPATMEWASQRNRTALLLWDNHQDIVHTLHMLMNSDYAIEGNINEDTDEPVRALLVDDSPTARVKFRKLLIHAGYVTETASSAEEAFEKCQSSNFDIAIVDYFMPVVAGNILCRQLRDTPKTSHMVTAILTSTYLDSVITNSLASGAVDCMFKNESNDLFLARVAAMSRTARMARRTELERQRLDGILSSVGDGVYGVDRDGLITFVNPAVRHILGIDKDVPLIGNMPSKVFHYICPTTLNSKNRHCYVKQAMDNDQTLYAIESIFARSDGSPIQVEQTILPLKVDGQVTGAVIAFRDISMRKLLEEELKWQANHDPLTKLLNRNYFENYLSEEVQRLKRSKEQSALLYIDLDRFKYINDTIGHAAGDQLLIEIGEQLQKRLRKADLLARLGGDEFAIILHNVNPDSLFEASDVFRQVLDDYKFTYNSRTYQINGCIGVAPINEFSATPGEVLANADIACNIAKNKGRNTTHIYNVDQDDKVSMDMELGWSIRLSQALSGDGFTLHHQPILPLDDINPDQLTTDSGVLWEKFRDSSSDKDLIFEVLIRMNNPHGELIAPNAFIPTAERFNMMPDIDNWVLRNTLKNITYYQRQFPQARFSINLSGQSLGSTELIDILIDAIENHSLQPGSIIFEITESCAIAHLDEARHFIGQMLVYGCNFALDDFGSGYCSFSHLKNLPVEYIKIDGLFVKDIVNDPMDREIVSSINNIAHSLGMKTVAEFVEDLETVKLLKKCGVDYIQGYYITKPYELSMPDNVVHADFKSGNKPG
ncbi:MAG: EAL domain-containing protein [Gammaproteobacteria bacterium]|nr:EAL domain-containing protein [Gammaproteobacteria bacterium]